MTQPLIILEGADCSGKTTLAKQLCAAMPDAHYVHYSDYKQVKLSLPRMYTEGMLPAVQNHRPVIMDRCWISEEPYCHVFRPLEKPRLDDLDSRMLERLALTCEPILVYCDPGKEQISSVFETRKGIEYLDTIDQLIAVRDGYTTRLKRTHLPVIKYNWMKEPGMVAALVDRVGRLQAHMATHHVGAGSLRARTLIVGDSFATHQEFDPHYQWPFASFSGQGCSRWLSAQLDKAKIAEHALWWVNQDMLEHSTQWINSYMQLDDFDTIIALGNMAMDKLTALSISGFIGVPHPQWWKRFSFNSKDEYPLITQLKELL